ncbi:TolC family protein, partial [Pseudomonas sp. NPDC078863]|uniref:TolC family protein n=1 Tax=Pseudomonas sp. NPDC078863 TaxID=3364425 RepID=UPI0037CAD29E
MNTRALSLVLAAMTLAGCANYSGLDTLGQPHDDRDLHCGKSLRDVTHTCTASTPADWWKSLGDPQLDGLIQEALQNSPDMQVADARAHQAEAAAYAANAARMPTVDASAGVSRSRLAKDQDPRGQGDAYSTVRNI